MTTDEIRAIIFYGDITGFTSWSRRVRKEQVRELIETTYRIYKHWANYNGFWIKTLGDGFVSVCELAPTNDRKKILRMLRVAAILIGEINGYLEKLPFPRPGGFRLRVPIGDVWKFTDDHGEIDYIGYQMDFGRRMLDIEKTVLCIITEATYDAIGRRGNKKTIIKKMEMAIVELSGVLLDDRRNFYQLDYKGDDRRKK